MEKIGGLGVEFDEGEENEGEGKEEQRDMKERRFMDMRRW